MKGDREGEAGFYSNWDEKLVVTVKTRNDVTGFTLCKNHTAARWRVGSREVTSRLFQWCRQETMWFRLVW